ncbi:MG2 domain-containing protein [Flavobacterium sp. FBOR7N2.3]|uniref:MG2 domain-containing protein n=1 Tax=Flavobacterium magnesitis TaxID=3138077 RepID=A0ABV4TFI7_9FLAO
MKKLFLLLVLISTSVFAQNFQKNWDKVIDHEKSGKIKSASKIVDGIYKKAVSQKNEPQIIKCFFYQSKYLQVVDENAQTKILDNLNQEINRASIPSKSILNLVHAKCLNDYFNRNNHTIRNRTNTASINKQFMTWTENDFTTKINSALKKTLENENILKATPLKGYEAIFDYFDQEKFKKQNLFDYLLQEKIAFYTQKIEQWRIKKSEFVALKDSLFGNSEYFVKNNFDFITDKYLKRTLKLLQIKEKNSPSLANQLERIQFCATYLIDSNEVYLSTLKRLQKLAKDTLLTQKIQLDKAVILSNQASRERCPDCNIQAVAILDSIIRINNISNSYKQAVQKKQDIVSKSLSIQMQKQSYSDENTRAFIAYKNVNHVAISFYEINHNQAEQFRNSSYPKDSLADVIIKNQKTVITKNYPLLNKKDYFEYSTEVLLPQLKTGNYLAYFESDSDIENKKAFAYETISITNLSVLASQKDNTETFQILDRKTGKPLENVSIKLLNQTIKTDKNGLASYTKEKNHKNYKPILLTTANDTLLVTKNYSAYYNEYDATDDENTKGKVEFYLDRAIYRPGQTVYYKGIAFQKKGNTTAIVAQTSFKITVKDVNNNDFKEFEVTTNEFGSFSGEFVLSKTGLTGNFRIEADEPDDYEKDAIYNKVEDEHPFWDVVTFEYSEISFKVEEYKRPKFEVRFEPITKSYRINQNIQVKGIAKAFAGSNITDAKVSYTVVCNSNYYNSEASKNLATAETITDASGKFKIDFKAVPFKNAEKENLPVFEYTIQATVTDINGETHSANTIIKVGYHDLVLSATIPNQIETKNKNEIRFSSTNLNGAFLATKGEIKIYYVRPLINKFKPRIWEKPEIESITDEEFEQLFPYENNTKTVADSLTEVLVFSKKVDTATDKKLILDFISNHKSGDYKVIFSAKDAFDNNIKTQANFRLIQSNDKYNLSKLFTATQVNSNPKKDGFVLVKLISIIPNLYISTTGNYNSKTYFDNTFHLTNNETIIKIPLLKEFENKLQLSFQTVFENSLYYDGIEVLLEKEKEPKLEFSIESFRNKIQPGSTENWSFQLKATNSQQEAEVLASMYDSSLDQFTKKNWNGLAFYEYNNNHGHYKTSFGFDKIYSTFRNLNHFSQSLSLTNEETQLMWFGFDFNNSDSNYQQMEYQKQLNKKAKKPANVKMISGIVTDGKIPLLGVSIFIKGTQRSTITDFKGYYQIEAAKGEKIVFSYIGFMSKGVLVNSKLINVQLEESSNSLREVVVVGYGTQKRKDLVGSISSISGDKLRETQPVTFEEALQGKVAGVSSQPGGAVSIQIRGLSTSYDPNNQPLYIIDGEIVPAGSLKNFNPTDILSIDILKDASATANYGNQATNGVIIITTKKGLEALTQVTARKNLSETAFFYPNLKTDSKGKISFNFTSPEALTSWKLRLLAHNKSAVSAYLEKTVVTQKELMLLPNFPRFLREKDTIVISAKIANMTNQTKTGIAQLQFFDATTMQPIDSKMLNAKNVRNFNIIAFGNTTATWKISIPEGLQGVQYRIVAKAVNYSDGEENILPVLTNNMLVTENRPIWVRENSSKSYTFENLKNNNSTSFKNHQFTLEYTSNPTWLALQSLPYLMEYEHECAEQTFARFYANALASKIISSNPKIAALFENWRKNGKLNAKLEENEELKSIILAETPWLNDTQTETEKKSKLAFLFDLEKMKNSQEATFNQLKQKQSASGGFAWFDGDRENEYISRHILAGLGHLSKLDKSANNESKINSIAKTGIPFLDGKFLNSHKTRTKNLKPTDKLIWINPNIDLHYLYTRSFYLENYPLSDSLKKTTKLYLEIAKKEWSNYSLYEKGLAALTLNRFGEREAAKKILESLKETASNNEDWGMYWIENKAGWYWYQAPIETQALLIEAFSEITNDNKSVDAMKVWLLKNKQTKNWPTTKSTTEAIYALLLQGSDWLSVKDNTIIKVGEEKLLTKKLSENEKESETGYLKLNWKANEIKKEMATTNIQNKSKVPGYGGVYWQYFEDLDKIKTDDTNTLSVSKELHLKKNAANGMTLQKITTKNPLQIGDLVTVRLIITTKENMEFVHLKDLRASCFEPEDALSSYDYKEGLAFYKSTKDAATHFFFDRINKGVYVLEYDVRVNNSGDFSNGVTTIQSMYAPEFTSHTKGIRVQVK